jgi:hypothetical protein
MKQTILVFIATLALLAGSTRVVHAQVIDTQYISASSSDCSTAGSCATFDPGALPAVTYAVSGTFTATLQMEATADGINWTSVNIVNIASSVNGTQISGAGTFSFSNSGFVKVRVRCSAYTSGLIRITATRGWAVARLFSPIVTSITTADGTASAPSHSFTTSITSGLFYGPAGPTMSILGTARTGWGSNTIGYQFDAAYPLTWSATTVGNASDIFLTRVAAGQLGVGASTLIQPVINGTFTTSTVSTCTIADTNETDLWTYTLPAGALNTDGRGVRVTVFGTTAATANTKSLRFYFGASNLSISVVGGGLNNVPWQSVFHVIRTGAATQLSEGQTVYGGLGAAILGVTNPTETLANAVIIKMTGQNGTAAANDICVKGAFVETIK